MFLTANLEFLIPYPDHLKLSFSVHTYQITSYALDFFLIWETVPHDITDADKISRKILCWKIKWIKKFCSTSQIVQCSLIKICLSYMTWCLSRKWDARRCIGTSKEVGKFIGIGTFVGWYEHLSLRRVNFRSKTVIFLLRCVMFWKI